MKLISVKQRGELIDAARSLLKLELRDNYAVDAELFASWQTGDLDAVRRAAETYRDKFLERHHDPYRRIKVVSEPLSDYHRFVLDFTGFTIEATGASVRWLPRRLTSTLLLPGNDYFVLDEQLAIFNVLDGADDRCEQQLYRDPDVVKTCLDAFAAAWEVAIPFDEYRSA